MLRSHRRSVTLTSLLLVGPCVASCEGNSSSSNQDAPGPLDHEAPLVVVQFPPERSLTDATRIVLALSVEDATGVAAVRVAGTAAARSSDGFWRISVPLVLGEQTFTVATRDTLGNESSSAARLSVRREGALWIEPGAVAFDSLTSEALVLDPPSSALFGVDSLSGARSLRSGPGLGTGPLFTQARDVEFLAGRNAALVTDGATSSVFLVQLSSGARSILSGGPSGGGAALVDPHGIAADELRNRALVLDGQRAELLAVDLSSGERTTLSSASVGTGPPLDGTRRISLDTLRSRALLSSILSPVILAVDLANGNRTVLSGGTVGSGPAFVRPADLVVDRFMDRALVVDAGAAALYEVALSTGARRVLSAASNGSGPSWMGPEGVTLHLGSVPLVVDHALDALFEVGATSGNRRILSRVVQGTGPQFTLPVAAATGNTGPERPTLSLCDGERFFSMELGDGDRALVSGAGLGSGPPFVALVDVVVSITGILPCTTVLDAGAGALLGVDVTTGTRTELSGPGRGAGPLFTGPRRMALRDWPGQTCAPLADVIDKAPGGPAALVRVDLLSGERTILSDEAHGIGPVLDDPVALDTPPSAEVTRVLDRSSPRILGVTLDGGDRTVLAELPVLFAGATDLASEPAGERVLITVASPPGLHAVHLPTDATDVLSDVVTGSGPAFGRPMALELVTIAGARGTAGLPIAHVVDQLRGAVVAVDPFSGERVIRTK